MTPGAPYLRTSGRLALLSRLPPADADRRYLPPNLGSGISKSRSDAEYRALCRRYGIEAIRWSRETRLTGSGLINRTSSSAESGPS